MKVKAATILHPRFSVALSGLLNKSMPMSQCVKLSEAIGEIENHSATINRIRQGLIDQYIEKDNRGQAKMGANDQPVYKNDEAAEEFRTKTTELLNQEYEVNLEDKIVLTDSDTMTPQDYMLLKDFVTYKSK